MNAIVRIWLRYAGSGCVGALLLTQTSCGHSTLSQGAPASHESPARRVLSRAEAATLAARLVNDECERLYKKRPFRAEQHRAIMQDNQYRWGGLDIAAPTGFSALVTFRPDGSHPDVQLYYSTDTDIR